MRLFLPSFLPFLSCALSLYRVPSLLSFLNQRPRNNRHFLHDPQAYKDSITFSPDRLIAKPSKPAETDPFDVAFGYGRW